MALLLLLAAASVAAPPVQAARDGFAERHEEAVALNGPGLRFSVRVVGGRSWFYQGELIPIELTYESLDGAWHGSQSVCMGSDPIARGAMDLTIDRADDVTVDPGFDLLASVLSDQMPAGVAGCVVGGLVPGPIGTALGGVSLPPLPSLPPPRPPPITKTVLLNDRLRFDRPGRYRVFFGRHVDHSGIQTSVNMLDIEIRPQDPAWAADTLAAAVKALDSLDPIRDRERWQQARRQVATLDSPAAIDEIVRRFGGDVPRDPNRDGGWYDALIRAGNRDTAIAALDRALVSGKRRHAFFVRTIARLQTAREAAGRTPSYARYRARIEQTAARYAAALGSDFTNALREEMRESGKLGGRSLRSDALMLLMKDHPREAQEALLSLPRNIQNLLLTNAAPRFQHASLVPLLRAVFEQPGAPDTPDAREAASAALELLHDISPSDARQLTLIDLRRDIPHAEMRVLAALPDPLLPEIEPALSRLLRRARTPAALASAMERAERYASAPLVRAVPARMAEDAAPAAIAYLLRVAPDTGIQRLTSLLARGGQRDEDGGEHLLSSVAALRTSPQLERISIAHLDDRDPAIALDAVAMLGRHGSASAKEALLARLQGLRTAWTARRVNTPPSESIGWLEAALVENIIEGAAWYTSPEEIDALTAVCRTRECRSNARSLPPHEGREADLIAMRGHPTVDAPDGLRFSVLQYQHLTRAALQRKVRQLPPGTALQLRILSLIDYEPFDTDERAALTGELEALLRSAGLRLQ